MPSSPSVYNSLWLNALLVATWGTAIEICTLHRNRFCSKLKVVLLGSAIGLTHWCAIQPDTSSAGLLPGVMLSHIRAHDAVVGCAGVCACVSVCDCCEGQRERLSCTGAGSEFPWCSIASRALCCMPRPVLGVKISSYGAQPAGHLCHWEARGDERGVSQLHRWSPLRLQSNWGTVVSPKVFAV